MNGKEKKSFFFLSFCDFIIRPRCNLLYFRKVYFLLQKDRKKNDSLFTGLKMKKKIVFFLLDKYIDIRFDSIQYTVAMMMVIEFKQNNKVIMSICVYQGKFSLFLFLFNSIFDIRESFAIFRFFSSILQPAFIRACIYFGRDYLESLQNHYIIHEEYLQKIFRKKKLNLLIVFRYCCLFVCCCSIIIIIIIMLLHNTMVYWWWGCCCWFFFILVIYRLSRISYLFSQKKQQHRQKRMFDEFLLFSSCFSSLFSNKLINLRNKTFFPDISLLFCRRC